MSDNKQAETEVLDQIKANFERAQQEFLALIEKIEQDPEVLVDPEHQARLAKLNELVSVTHQRMQEAAARFNWAAAK